MRGCWTPPISWLLGWRGTGFPSQPTSRKATLTSPSAGEAVILSRAQPSFTPTMSPAVFRPFSVIPSSRSLVKFQICLARSLADELMDSIPLHRVDTDDELWAFDYEALLTQLYRIASLAENVQ